MCDPDQDDDDLVEPVPPEDDMTYAEEGAIISLHYEEESQTNT